VHPDALSVVNFNLRANFRIKQIFETGMGNCTYKLVCEDHEIPSDALRCMQEVDELMKLRTVTTDSQVKIPHYEREASTVGAYGSKYRTERLHTLHIANVRVTLVLELYSGGTNLTARLLNTINEVTSSLVALSR
jgi:hypothetical protein